jgi:hypothetical protein
MKQVSLPQSKELNNALNSAPGFGSGITGLSLLEHETTINMRPQYRIAVSILTWFFFIIRISNNYLAANLQRRIETAKLL